MPGIATVYYSYTTINTVHYSYHIRRPIILIVDGNEAAKTMEEKSGLVKESTKLEPPPHLSASVALLSSTPPTLPHFNKSSPLKYDDCFYTDKTSCKIRNAHIQLLLQGSNQHTTPQCEILLEIQNLKL